MINFPSSPTTGQIYTENNLSWKYNGTAWDALVDGFTLEGVDVRSTGETGGNKFLREDGDGTCSWAGITLASGFAATSGAGAPNTAPTVLPSAYYDTVNEDYYFATGTSSASDWSISLSGGTLPKGSILVSDGSALVELPVGTNGQVPIADSSQSTGWRWGAQSGGSGSVSNGAGAPTSAPSTLNDIYHDTTNKRVYHAFGTASVSDWRYTETSA